MTEDDFLGLLDRTLRPLGDLPEIGEEYSNPPLDVLRYYRRPLKLAPIPILGRGCVVVAIVREPAGEYYGVQTLRSLAARTALAVNGRFPPLRWGNGLSIALLTVFIAGSALRPSDEADLAAILPRRDRTRTVPAGCFRIDLDKEAFAFALAETPGVVEPKTLAEALARNLRQFVASLRFE